MIKHKLHIRSILLHVCAWWTESFQCHVILIRMDARAGGSLISVCYDKETIEIRNLLKFTKIYRGLPKFMANIAVLLEYAVTSGRIFVQSYSSVASFASPPIKSSMIPRYEELNPQKNFFWPGDLNLWPMTLTFKLDVDILPLDLHVGPFRRESGNRHTHPQTHNVKTITPVADAGCKIYVWKSRLSMEKKISPPPHHHA